MQKLKILLLFLQIILVSCNYSIQEPLALNTPLNPNKMSETHSPSPTLIPSLSATIIYDPTPTQSMATPSIEILFSPVPTLEITDCTPFPENRILKAGSNTWNLISVEISKQINVLGYEVYPSWQDYPITHHFLLVNFECVSGESLIELYTGMDMGLTFIHNSSGYQNIYIIDSAGEKYPVTMMGDCWLAIPILPEKHGFILYFQNLEPLQLSEIQP